MPGLGPIVVSTGAAAPDRRQLIDLKNELARTYNADDETTLAIAGDAIRSAIRVFNRYNWPWEVLSHNLSISSTVDTYSLPQPWKAPCSFHLTDGDGRKKSRLAYMPYESYLSEYDLTGNGEPRMYTLRNQFESGQVTLWPRPGSSYTGQIDYYRRTPAMTGDEESLEAPGEAEEAIMAWAFYEFVKRIGGEFMGARIGAALADARAARAELVAHVALRGDVAGVI